MSEEATVEAKPSHREVGDAKLAPIRAWAQANHGTINRIAVWLQEKTGESITRQTVGRWLASEPEKRQMPSYGWGILLEDAYEALGK